MRTTIKIDDEIFAELKKAAANEGRTLAAVVEDALRESLARRRQQDVEPSFVLPTFGDTGLVPGVTVETMSAVIEQEEEEKFRRIVDENS